MAFQEKRPGRKGVYVYYNEAKTNKLRQIPREQTKHLDGKPPEEVIAWIEKWEKSNGVSRDRSERMNLKPGDKLTALWDRYQAMRMATRKRKQRESEKETKLFEATIIPYFVGLNQNKNPDTWHDLVPDFHIHLSQKGYSDAYVQKILWTLERFSKHLVFSRYMTFPYVVQVPSREDRKVTPLQTTLEPKKILSAKFSERKSGGRQTKVTIEDLRLASLLGYFAALRPSELWALEKSDLLTGRHAETETKTLEGFRTLKMGTKLSVSITKGANPLETKTRASKAVVNIWDQDAAKAIVDLVKDREDGKLFPITPIGMEQAWRRTVRPRLNVTVHDLRRSSALYLGRKVRVPLTLLQEHMRHEDIETTMLYIREPSLAEKPKKRVIQNFDDI